jgi:ComF family protein
MLSNRASLVFDRCIRIAQTAWPTACVLCGDRVRVRTSGDRSFCGACEASLPLLPAEHCRICAIPLAAGEVCGACLEHPPVYDAAIARHTYAFPVDALIHAYKYGGELALAPVLARSLTWNAALGADVLVPMPLSESRLRSRGFNQAHELARHIGRKLRIPVLRSAVRKVIETGPQAALPWKARARNVRGAFVCDASLSGLHVAVVDDVMTTGATLNELARILKAAGAARVSGWVVARTLPRD